MQPPKSSSARIIVIGDRPGSRQSTVRTLSASGLSETIEAAGVDEAISQLAGIDLIVLDANASEDAALAQCRQLREHCESELPILSLAPAGLREALDAVADVCLAQPVEPAVLIAVISTLLRARAAETALKPSKKNTQAPPQHDGATRVDAENGLKDDMLSVLSHELRNPLNAISGWVQVLGQDRSPETLREGIAAIGRNTQIQIELISDLVDASRALTGKLELDLQSVDLGFITEQAVTALYADASGRRVTLRSAELYTCMVRGDQLRLQQLVRSLIGLGIRHTAEGGTIGLTLAQDGDLAMLSISIDRCDIEQAVLDGIFNVSASKPRRRLDGLGLKLLMAKRLAELHGGALSATTDASGALRFALSMPSEADAAPIDIDALTAQAMQAEVSRLAGIDVMVVDPDTESRQALRDLLRSLGANMIECASSERALKLLRGMHPSVIILAAALAGDDLGRFTAGARRYGGVEQPMIVLLPSDAAAMSASALDGFQAQLHRPVTREALCAAVESVVSARH